MRQPPGTRVALVRKARTLEPPSGSLRAKAAIFCPASAGTKQRVRCSGVPARQIGQMPRCECADQLDAKAWLQKLSSSRTMQSLILSMPLPPSASG